MVHFSLIHYLYEVKEKQKKRLKKKKMEKQAVDY